MNHPAVVKAAQEIWKDILDRRGMKWETQKVDDNVRDEQIFPAWVEIIERETKFSRLVEAATEFVSTPCETTGLEDMEPGCCRACRLRSVLAEIKDLGNGPRLRS